MKYTYIVLVDDGQCTGASFVFDSEFELIDFIKTCLHTSTERSLQIEMKLEKD